MLPFPNPRLDGGINSCLPAVAIEPDHKDAIDQVELSHICSSEKTAGGCCHRVSRINPHFYGKACIRAQVIGSRSALNTLLCRARATKRYVIINFRGRWVGIIGPCSDWVDKECEKRHSNNAYESRFHAVILGRALTLINHPKTPILGL